MGFLLLASFATAGSPLAGAAPQPSRLGARGDKPAESHTSCDNRCLDRSTPRTLPRMSDVLAVVAKAVFEKQAPKNAKVGDVWNTAAYLSHHAKLEPLGAGGALFLATVRPPDERLWLVAILEAPKHGKDGWESAPNVVPITDITAVLAKLRFESGKGNTAEPGKLGMSLQTPRGLTAEDVALLRGALGSSAPANAAASAAPRAEPTAGAETKAPAKSGTKAQTKAQSKPPAKTQPAASAGATSEAPARIVTPGAVFDREGARAAHAGRVASELAGLDPKTRASIEELVAAASKSPKKSIAALKKLVATFGAKKSSVGRVAYDAMALACLDRHPGFAANAFGEARAWERKDKRATPLDEDLATLRVFSSQAAIEDTTLVQLLADERLVGTRTTAGASEGERAALHDLVVELAGTPFAPTEALAQALAAYDPALAGEALRRWVGDAAPQRFASLDPAVWQAFGHVLGDEVRRDASVRRWAATWTPALHTGAGRTWLEVLGEQGVTEAVVAHEPSLLPDHLTAFVATAGHYRTLGSTPETQRSVVFAAERVFRCVAPVMRRHGLSLDLSRPNRPRWKPEYIDLPRALLVEMLLAADVPLRLPPDPDTEADALLPLLHPGLVSPEAMGAYGALERVSAHPLLARSLAREFLPGHDEPSDLHEHLGQLNQSEGLVCALPSLAAFVETIGRSSLAAFIKHHDYLEAFVQAGVVDRSPALAAALRALDLPTLLQRQLSRGIMAEWGWPSFDKLADEMGTQAMRNAVDGWKSYQASPQLDVVANGGVVSLGPDGGGGLVDRTKWADQTPGEVFFDGVVCVVAPPKTHVLSDGSVVEAGPGDRLRAHAVDRATGVAGAFSLPSFFREAFASVPAGAQLSAQASRLFAVSPSSIETALGASGGVAGLAVFRVPGAPSSSYLSVAVRPDGRRWSGRTPPAFLLGFPGRDAVYADGLDDAGMPHFAADGDDLQAELWGGSPVNLPADYWHLFEPRDAQGSKALAACSRETAEVLLAAGRSARGNASGSRDDDFEKLDYGDLVATVTGPKQSIADAQGYGPLFAAVQQALPTVTHPRLVTGIAEIVLLAAREETRLADLHGKLAKLLRAKTTKTATNDTAAAATKRSQKPALTNAEVGALAEVFAQDITPWWVTNRGEALGAQIDDVDTFLFEDGAGPRAAFSPARTAFGWHHLVARMGEVLFALLAIGTPDDKRKQLVIALERWAETTMARHTDQLRIVSLRFDSLPHATMDNDHPDWLMAWENRYFLRLTGIQNGQSSFLAIERAPDGVFRAPPGSVVEWEARDQRASHETVQTALTLLRERGPMPWDPAIGEAICAGTGLGWPSAALLWGGSNKPFAPSKQGKATLG
jgi:hypothetical protein